VGQNLVGEERYAAGQTDRLPALAAELVRLKVDLIGQSRARRPGGPAGQLPSPSSCFGVSSEQAGLSPVWPTLAGNVTTVGPVRGGSTELLKEAVPKLTRVSIKLDPTFPGLLPLVRRRWRVRPEGLA
jgi:putative ABC transport system substrate-binding protein